MSKIKCNHCHLEFEESVMINEGELHFCCNGCQGVYHLLQDEHLDSFYDKLGNKSITPPIKTDGDTQKFDMESFEKRFIKTTEDGFKSVDLIIEGIHCAACVWLNEKVLYDTDGVIEANINFTNNKAKIIWDDSQIKLSQIIDKIRAIGYNAYAYDASVADKKAAKSKRDYFIRMMVAVFASMNIMMLSVAKYTGFFTGITDDVKNLIHIGEFILTTPVLFYSGAVFFKGAYFGIRNKIVNMDLLVASGASFTYLYSLFVLFGGAGESYFDSVTMIITFVLVGKYLEVIGKKSAVDTLDKIKSQVPIEATIIEDNTKKVISVDEIKIGDIIELKSSEKVAVDGIIVSGNANFDESSMTGESEYIYKKEDSKIFSGTINIDGNIRYKATTDFASSTLNSIVTLLEDSLSSKPEIEYKANNISKYFSSTILALSILTFIAWSVFGFDFGFASGSNDFEKAFIVAISVIVIACPCALALATPIASLVGIGELAKKGLLFKEAKFIETMAKADTIVLDKTGTITEGKLSVKEADIKVEDINILYSLVDSSIHPVSVAVKKYLKETYNDLEHLDLEDVKTLEAKGMSATYKGKKIVGGNKAALEEFGIAIEKEFDDTIFAFAQDNKHLATFVLEDSLKEGAKEFISNMKELGLDIVMLTGDNERVAKKIASSVGIDNFQAHISPLGKADFVKKLREEGKTIIMAGDGANDSVALSNSNIAVAMGNGADISIAVSDVVLLDNSLKSLQEAFEISNRTYKYIKQNLYISLLYNVITIPLAMFGWVIPLVAAASMSLSSLIVVANSMRIKNK